MRFRVHLETFDGPLDLLLYLVRRHELDVLDVPLAQVTEQYLEILAAIEQIDVDAVGDFLEVATRLMEIKSRMILPRQEEIEEDQIEDPRQDLVQRLLEYRRFKDAASMLEERGKDWQLRFARQTDDLGDRPLQASEQPIQQVELWDLVSAFARVIREKGGGKPTRILHDETPIETYMQLIRSRLASEGRVAFSSMFAAGMSRSQLAGVFLALLELIREHQASAEQAELFAEIWISQPAPTAAGEHPSA
jgi:segregation and condensation protein A